MAVLEASPACAAGHDRGYSLRRNGRTKPPPDDWAMVELVCHLRDTEREVHCTADCHTAGIAGALRGAPGCRCVGQAAALPERRWPQQALQEFAAARAACVGAPAEAAPESAWSKQARHAIFGPSSFLEVVGFMAEHDRLHLRQAWRTLRAAKQLRIGTSPAVL